MGIFKAIKGAFRRHKIFATGGGISLIRHCEILRSRIVAIYFLFILTIPNLHTTELNQICESGGAQCKISTNFDNITNSSIFITGGDVGIVIDATIDNFTNYNTIKVGRGNQSFSFEDSGFIKNFTNYGTTEKMFWGGRVGIVTNYGTMGGIVKSDSDSTLTLNNKGIMRPTNDSWGRETKTHLQLSKGAIILIQNYQIKVDEDAMTFNKFNGWGDNNSHLVISGSGVTFKDGDSKIILGFGEKFQFGEKYLIGKLVTDTGGSAYSDLSVDFSRLMPKNDIYTLYKQGEYFIARLQPQHSAISNISKSNIRTMNNFYTISNSMIYPRKTQNLGKKNQNNLVILRERSNRRISNIRDSSPKAQNDNIMLDSAISLKFYESFSYRNESVNRRIQRQNKRNYSRKSQNQTQNLKESQSNPQNQRFSQNLTQNLNYSQTPHNYYFILTPFFNYNSFAKSGNYNLSGFDYGFLTAFSTQVAESNSLGAHFIFSYGSLGDKQDKDLSIKSLNLNLGLNYKLDLIYDMYLKARGDFYYFLNQVKTLTMFEAIKPNNLGFGASVIFGKDFNFGKGGVLGVEAGIDYKALQSNTISLQNNATKTISETYNKALYNLIYVDLGMSYNKYFGGFGINLGTGFKANLAPKLAESILMLNSQNLRFILDNDKYLAYANAGISYVLNTKNFDMEFSLAYYGNFGDRVISNGGGVELRVVF